MKILIVNGSPRGERSNTKKLTDTFVRGIKSANKEVEIDELNLSKLDINSCIGCFACWNNTERNCALKDDMTKALELYKRADCIIWSTPIYHHTFTNLMKKFIERTLPISSPLIIHDGQKYTHPPVKKEFEEKKHILISTCGFPEYHNFDMIKRDFDRILEKDMATSICCVMGELLKEAALFDSFNWYFKGVEQAGYEFINKGRVSHEVECVLKRPLIDIEDFVAMANISWKGLDLKDGVEVKSNKGEGYIYLSQMKFAFNKKNNLDLDVHIAFSFEDTGEDAYFHIDKGSVEVYQGKRENPDLRIITKLSTWKAISNGEIDGADALMKGLYKVEGSIELMMKMDILFGSDKEQVEVEVAKNYNKKFFGIHGNTWMQVAFLPWMISWTFGHHNSIFASILPLILSLIIVFLKRTHKATTYFERSTMLYFTSLSIMTYSELIDFSLYGNFINSFSLGFIWLTSLLSNKSLTAEYSIYDQDEELEDNPIFNRTNEYITLFWASIFWLQGALNYLLYINDLSKFGLALILLFIGAMKFTKFFSEWYPNYKITGLIKQ